MALNVSCSGVLGFGQSSHFSNSYSFLVLHPSGDFLVCLANGENQADYVTGSNLIGGLLYLHYCFASGLTWKHPLLTRLLEKENKINSPPRLVLAEAES